MIGIWVPRRDFHRWKKKKPLCYRFVPVLSSLHLAGIFYHRETFSRRMCAHEMNSDRQWNWLNHRTRTNGRKRRDINLVVPYLKTFFFIPCLTYSVHTGSVTQSVRLCILEMKWKYSSNGERHDFHWQHQWVVSKQNKQRHERSRMSHVDRDSLTSSRYWTMSIARKHEKNFVFALHGRWNDLVETFDGE